MNPDGVLDKLINQFKSNDVDVKVDALNKLQAQFESGIEIENPDTFVNIFKNCLRSSNQHLTAAAVCALPPLLPLTIDHLQNGTVDISTLRLVLTTLLPLVMERLGDKDRVQIKARDSIALLGGYSFKSGSASVVTTRSRDGKGLETPNMIFEKLLKELGLASKAWKIREQSILVLVAIRRTYPQFPFRPYLSLLVDCLEDTDAHVRDCARSSVVELFTGPGVTDAARADLKKEMARKGVRKTIADGVFSKLLGASSVSSNPQSREGSENGDAIPTKKEYIPPSLVLQGRRPQVPSQSTQTTHASNRAVSQGNIAKEPSRPASRADTGTPPPPLPSENTEVQTVFIASSRDLESEFLAMAKPFDGKETEHNWAAREQAILRVRGMLKGDLHLRYPDVFLASLKDGFMQWSLKTLASLRTTVAGNTCQLYSELATSLGPTLDPFCDLLLTQLLKMSGLAKKITAQQSQSSVTSILTHTSAQPRVVFSLLWSGLQEKNVQMRAFMVGHIKTYMEIHGQRTKNALEASGNLEVLDKCIRKALSDPNPSVRETARKLFWDFDEIWPENGQAILDSMDTTARKQLEKICPDPYRQSIPPTTPKVPKKGSVAAAIAASRARAKAIATAPPTLRHQATSASHNLPGQRRAGSPGSPTTPPRSSIARPSSPLRLSSSPPAVRGSGAITRSITVPAMPFHTRTPSGGTARVTSPVQLPLEPSTVRRGTSNSSSTSPARGSIVRKALQTPLPASPPTSPHQVSPTPRPMSILSRNVAVSLPRISTLFPQMGDDVDESLLLAQTVPIPLDDESEDEVSVNLMSLSNHSPNLHSVAWKPQTSPESHSPQSVNSKPMPSESNTLSLSSITTISVGDQPIVEDALKARAEQAESAAERLLELVEPETETMPHPTLPPSLSLGNQNGSSLASHRLPVTPTNSTSYILKQAAMFQDSPAYPGRTSLLDVLQETKQESWWSKRRSGVLLKQAGSELNVPPTLLEESIGSLSSGLVDDTTFYKIAGLSLQNPVVDSPPASPAIGSSSPTPFDSSRSKSALHWDIWDKDRNFERLFRALLAQLTPDKDGEVLEAGLVAVSAFIENQFSRLEGKEAELFSVLLRIRYSNKVNVLEATNAIRDMFASKLEPVYGLTTIHASLRDFYRAEPPSTTDVEVKAAAYAFGLIALGKFILRLPAEVAEEELPRMRTTFITALNDKSSLVIRESAAVAIIAAQLVLRDETHLFALLDGLTDDKKNLLTYLFDKHGARGVTMSNKGLGFNKLEKEIQRLDTRTSTPSRRLGS